MTNNQMQNAASRRAFPITLEDVVAEIKRRGDRKAITGMARFGIQTSKAFGVSVPQLRELSRKIGKNHELAQRLWRTGIHEARILAGMIEEPARVTEDQMEEWDQIPTHGTLSMAAVETSSTRPRSRLERPANGR